MAQWNYNTNFSSLTGLPTPELKISETIGNLLGVPNQMNGTSGSNLFGEYQVTPQEQGNIDYINQINKTTPQYPQLSGTQNLSRISSNPPSVLGASTTNGGGGGGGTDRAAVEDAYRKMGWTDMNAAWDDALATNFSKLRGTSSSGPSYEDIQRNQINEGYNSYFNQLDAMMGGLGDQKVSQDALIGSQFSGGLTDLGLQKQQNLNELGTQERKAEESQVKTLKDISDNIRNLMQAGNTYLGSRGAGDSSAVNQYGYALTKLGSQQRGDVMGQTRQIMSEIDDRKSRLDNTFLQEKNKLTMRRDEAIQGVATWFAEAQNQIRDARARGELGKSQDLQSLTREVYNTALQKMNNVQNFINSRQQQLESWALNNSKSLAEAKQNLAGIANYTAPGQTYSQISGTPTFDAQGNMGVDFRGGVGTGFGLTEDQKRLLGIA